MTSIRSKNQPITKKIWENVCDLWENYKMQESVQVILTNLITLKGDNITVTQNDFYVKPENYFKILEEGISIY